MAVNLTGLAPITTAATALSNLVLVSPQKTVGYQPQNKNGSNAQQPPAILFHYEGEQTVTIESDITDHFIEDNTAIQDQVALKPEIVTTHGFIGELNDISPKALEILKFGADKLTTVGAYTPKLSSTALIAYTEAFFLYQTAENVVNAGVSAWSSLLGNDGENVIGSTGLQNNAFNQGSGQIANHQNKQQVAFQQFYGYWRARTLFTVQTPWAVFQNMAIASLRAMQDAETRVITDFEVKFKMMRFADTSTSIGLTPITQGRLQSQSSGLIDLGTTTPASSTSLADGLRTMGA